MKSVKHFENFQDKKLDIQREEIVDFLSDSDLIEIDEISFPKIDKDFLSMMRNFTNPLLSNMYPKPENLFGNDEIMKVLDSRDRDGEEICNIKLGFYHPNRIRSASFGYGNFMKQTIKKCCERMHVGYGLNVFLYLYEINYMEKRIATIHLVLINS